MILYRNQTTESNKIKDLVFWIYFSTWMLWNGSEGKNGNIIRIIQFFIHIYFRALVMGDGVPCYGALEIVGLLLLLYVYRNTMSSLALLSSFEGSSRAIWCLLVLKELVRLTGVDIFSLISSPSALKSCSAQHQQQFAENIKQFSTACRCHDKIAWTRTGLQSKLLYSWQPDLTSLYVTGPCKTDNEAEHGVSCHKKGRSEICDYHITK